MIMSRFSCNKTPSNNFTPPQSPTRSVKRKSFTANRSSRALLENGSLTCLPAKRNYHLEKSILSPTSYTEDQSLMAQYGIQCASKKVQNYHVSNAYLQEKGKDIKKGILGIILRNLGFLTGLGVLMLLSGFLGAYCYAIIERHYLSGDRCSPTIHQSIDVVPAERLSQANIQMHQMMNYMMNLAEDLDTIRNQISYHQNDNSGSVSQQPRGILEELFTSEPDLASAGNLGSVLATPDTVTYTVHTVISVLSVPWSLQLPHRPAYTTIKGLIQDVGDCWAFSGEKGRLVVALHQPSILSSISLSHIPSSLSPTGDIATAPKQFQILVHRSEEDLGSGLVLGEYEYSNTGPWRQTFTIDSLIVTEEMFKVVEFRFMNNHGNPNYTCVYRVHIHGKML